MALSRSSIKGGLRLGFDLVQGVTSSVEHMHETIARRPLPLVSKPLAPSGAHGLLAAGIYAVIRGITHGLREGADALQPMARVGSYVDESSEAQWVSALNGACGDHLEVTANALAIPMQWRLLRDGSSRELPLTDGAIEEAVPRITPNLVVFVHGLGMSEFGWARNDQLSVGDALEQPGRFSSLYLRYNTGRHISTNGRELAAQLQRLVDRWPVAVESISLVGHSMGGLVIRSACWYGAQNNATWLTQLQRVVCLGSPHQGAPLEKLGHVLDKGAEKIPYLNPLMFSKRRSAGIKDLRNGDLLDEDWQQVVEPSQRVSVPLLEGVEYYFIAASIGRDREDSIGVLLGDLLVRLQSAVGYHKDKARTIPIKRENCRVFYEKNHFDLLNHPAVVTQVKEWFFESLH